MYQHSFRRGDPFASRIHKPFLLCRQKYGQAASTIAAVSTHFCSGHLLDPLFNDLPGPRDSLAPAHPCTGSTCTWCHSDLTLPEVPDSAARTLSIACSSALRAAQGAILFPNNVIHCAC
jgi:hypothetical protein